MPTYDYVCSACGHEIEVVHGVHGHGPSACPRCGGPMRKSFTAPAVHFKGSGWAKKERGGSQAKGSKRASTTDLGSSATETGSTSAPSGPTGSTSDAGTSGDGGAD